MQQTYRTFAVSAASCGVPFYEKTQWIWLTFFGFAFAASVVLHMYAFTFTNTVAYVIASKRSGMILFAVVIASILATIPLFKGRFENELEHITYAVPGIICVIGGLLLVVLG